MRRGKANSPPGAGPGGWTAVAGPSRSPATGTGWNTSLPCTNCSPSPGRRRQTRPEGAQDATYAATRTGRPHPEGMIGYSPTFQRWVDDRQWTPVPEGRQNGKLVVTFSRPFGTCTQLGRYPTLKRWAILALSLRDQCPTATLADPYDPLTIPTAAPGLFGARGRRPTIPEG